MKTEANFAWSSEFSLEGKHLGFKIEAPNLKFQKTIPETHCVCEDAGGKIAVGELCG